METVMLTVYNEKTGEYESRFLPVSLVGKETKIPDYWVHATLVKNTDRTNVCFINDHEKPKEKVVYN